MNIFRTGRKEETYGKTDNARDGAVVEIKILGSGCPKCNALEKSVKDALVELGMEGRIEHVTDFVRIASYGVMSTPALVADGKVVSSGRVLSTEDAKNLILSIRRKI